MTAKKISQWLFVPTKKCVLEDNERPHLGSIVGGVGAAPKSCTTLKPLYKAWEKVDECRTGAGAGVGCLSI